MARGLSLFIALAVTACDRGADSQGSSDAGERVDARTNDVAANGCVVGAQLGEAARCTADNQRCSKVLRIVSYNVHALPELVSGENPKDRLRRIGEILAEQRRAGRLPDFVLLQEAFDKEDRLIDRAGFAEVIAGPESSTSLSSGLFALTDHPVVGRDSEAYEACAAEDCLSEKGVLAIATHPEGMPEPAIVITTHLQAQSENDATRIDQINELVPYLDKQGVSSGASIFAGDFNFKARPDHDAHPSYRHFLESTPYLPAGKECLDDPLHCSVDLGPDGNTDEADLWLSTNDHQFYFAADASPYDIAIVSAALTFTEDFEGEPLSDHWAKQFDYCFSWTP